MAEKKNKKEASDTKEESKQEKEPENPEFDINQTNIPRSSRPEEWTCVGLLGQVHVRVDATVQVEDWVMPVDGIGTKSEKRTPLKCMEIRQPFDAEKGYGVAFCLLK